MVADVLFNTLQELISTVQQVYKRLRRKEPVKPIDLAQVSSLIQLTIGFVQGLSDTNGNLFFKDEAKCKVEDLFKDIASEDLEIRNRAPRVNDCDKYIERLRGKVCQQIEGIVLRNSINDTLKRHIFCQMFALVAIILPCRAASEDNFLKDTSRNRDEDKTRKHHKVFNAYQEVLKTLEDTLNSLRLNS